MRRKISWDGRKNRQTEGRTEVKQYTPSGAGVDPGFQVRGGALKKLRRAKGGAKIFGVFRVKNHDFTPKNHIFSNFRGGARRVRPPLDPLLWWSGGI
jgi:hypothetical protein